MQVATLTVQICTGTATCAYNFLTKFSLSSLYLTLSSLSLSGTQLFLSLIWSIFLPLASVDHLSHRSPSSSITLSSFVSRCFRVEWAWSVGFGLNVSHHCHRHRHRHRLPLEVSILFLILAIATRGVDLVAQGEVSIPVWYHFDPICSRRGIDFDVGFDPFCWVCSSSFLPVGCVILVWYRCGLWVWVGGCVGKEMNIFFE